MLPTLADRWLDLGHRWLGFFSVVSRNPGHPPVRGAALAMGGGAHFGLVEPVPTVQHRL